MCEGGRGGGWEGERNPVGWLGEFSTRWDVLSVALTLPFF